MKSRFVGDEAVQRVQREPGNHDDRDHQHDLEEQHHGIESSWAVGPRRAPASAPS
ncbi:hypothetical protein I549_5833 [Mycobacterium avium subsp. avium 2285 (R)]|nr:hypothetical protein I549_5833 [Mycobacterium avium subsp. avium 2285 (R)]